MSTTTESPEENSTDEGNPGLKPRYLVIAIGVLFAAVTILSGVLGAIVFNFHDDSSISREVFGNIPGGVKLAFYVIVPILLVWGAVAFSQRVKNWERGAPDRRVTTTRNIKRRLEDFRAGVYMQTLLRDPAAGLMHSLIYFSFLILLAVTTVLEINHQLPDDAKFLHGQVYQGYSFVGDAAGVVFVLGVGWAIVRRYVQRPYRIRIKTKPEHALILGVLMTIGLTGFVTEMFRIAHEGSPAFEKWSFISYPLATLIDGAGEATLSNWHRVFWVVHVVSFFTFLMILPTTMLRHMFTSPLNMYLRDRDRPKGAMRAMPNLMQTELETFGASTVEDFTWKQLLDTDACTMCGRCTSQCPAHATGKPLDPREIVLKTGEVMAATGRPSVTPPIGVDSEITVSADDLFERITPEEIWSCTSCKACDEICPVNIEILDKILDMRRYLSLMESNFPTELGQAYRSMENSGNPWGLSQAERADWAKDLEGVKVIDGGDPFDAEYLYWVGCAGSFDDKNKKVSRALAKLLEKAGVSFAILGPAEQCTGDPARRSGNEYIFQMLAMQNIETLDSMGVRKIITQCPHCFNTFKNEYPQLGGDYEVIHHSQLLEQLIAEGRLDVGEASLAERVVFHDSCYLGRHNDIYMAPRNVIGRLGDIEVVEANRNGTRGMCCGAGGARMWMEEHTGKQVNVERSQELIRTGASRIATACPFCYVMIDDGAKAEGFEDEDVKVGDIAIHLLDALESVEVSQKPLVETVEE
ncbi:MAG: putative iron-sulfur-binding oxidoreductase FadF [Acidimicrobiales bacterium]|nr:MAG: 4Fe-4S dicluster domain-containing protein [Actinomycetota bacterium]MBV6507374.1 putative iron-sulfur-binding oxidoreductase FadF [Acidimicrobiales bacterium]RIK04500.1 MAG: iron-sulfur protein [Acidobacteriota bacterium]